MIFDKLDFVSIFYVNEFGSVPLTQIYMAVHNISNVKRADIFSRSSLSGEKKYFWLIVGTDDKTKIQGTFIFEAKQ